MSFTPSLRSLQMLIALGLFPLVQAFTIVGHRDMRVTALKVATPQNLHQALEQDVEKFGPTPETSFPFFFQKLLETDEHDPRMEEFLSQPGGQEWKELLGNFKQAMNAQAGEPGDMAEKDKLLP